MKSWAVAICAATRPEPPRMPDMARAEGRADERVSPTAAGENPCAASKHAASASGMIAARIVREWIPPRCGRLFIPGLLEVGAFEIVD